MDEQDSPLSPNKHEIGSFSQPTPHESRFIGSSSGIYFINTVKRAFESSGQHRESDHLPAAEDIVGGEDDYVPASRNANDIGHSAEVNVSNSGELQVISFAQLGSLPSYEIAQHLAIEYFKVWHPLFPFLSGTQFLQELENLYQDPLLQGGGSLNINRRRLCYLIIFQCVFGIGSLGVPPETVTPAAPLPRTNLLSLATILASKHDTLTVQTILTAQLYCVSTMALRTASSLGGLLSKLIYHAGFHRCPYRYPQVSIEDRDLRKRIVWSAYAMDRFICQALGLPVAFAESEIDVCVPGEIESHQSVSRSKNADSEIILANFIQHQRLVGRALEIFHISLHSRRHDPKLLLFLRSDVDRWFNLLPEEPQTTVQRSVAEEQVSRFLPFYHVLYEQLIISINRPSLSLPRTAPEFHHALQVTIGAAKRTITAMEHQTNLFWPGYVAAVWMSGLIIAFACQVALYQLEQGSQEILRCLDLLQQMSSRWTSAQRCCTALSTLLSDLRRPHPRSHSEAFGKDTDTRPAKQPNLSRTNGCPKGLEIDLIEELSQPERSHSTPHVTHAQEQGSNGQDSIEFDLNGVSYDINDFFKDLSWNNLFDACDITHNPELSLYPG